MDKKSSVNVARSILRLWRVWRGSDPPDDPVAQKASLGRRGETIAVRHLRQLGWRIIAAGTRTKFSELDIVAVDQRTVVFVEVKTRSTEQAGNPADAVDEAKQRRIVRAALAFLKRHELLEQRVRFDVVAIQWAPEAPAPRVIHYQDAFQSPERGQLFS